VVALAAAMRRLVDDAALRDRLGAGGAVRARDFSPDRIGAAVQAIYRDLLVPR
jgi:glycosyltransferase involved in cell wall biosynthesis